MHLFVSTCSKGALDVSYCNSGHVMVQFMWVEIQQAAMWGWTSHDATGHRYLRDVVGVCQIIHKNFGVQFGDRKRERLIVYINVGKSSDERRKMKYFIFVCYVSAVTSASALMEFHKLAAPLIDPLATNLYYVKSSRHKRATVTKSLNDPDNCISNCATQLNTRLTDLQLNATVASNITDATKLQYLCEAFTPTAPCFHQCPDSQLENLVEDFLPIMSLICTLSDQNYPELLASLACINSTKQLIDDKCNSKCNRQNDSSNFDSTLGNTFSEGGNHSTVQVNLLPSFVVYDNNKTQNTENFQAVCRYLSCIDDCDDVILNKSCGPQGVRIQGKLISTIVHAIKSLFRDLNAVDYEPEECRRYDLSSV